jgi:pyruvate-formate lyase-activating enzyme
MKENSLVPKMINYKTIEHERCEDAPFVGALIAACDCKFNCPNCFNQHIKALPTIEKSCDDIIAEVKANPFNKGVIFAGLEWTLQLNECLSLAEEAKRQGLQTMLYTGNDFKGRLMGAIILSNLFDYIKCGRYEEELKTANHIEYGVVLASANQHIYKRGADY